MVEPASSPRQPQVSVLILTFNEARNIQRCIASVNWSDDVVVLDSFSTDETCALAKSAGARVYQRAFDNFASQRNFALQTVEFKHDWILHLDADEEVTEYLRDEILQRIVSDELPAYRIPSKMIFQGKWLRFAGMYPSYQVRLGRKQVLKFQQVGHGQREELAPASIGTFKHAYLHHGFSKGLQDWIERHNRYSSDEARQGLEEIRQGQADCWGVFALHNPTRRRRALKQISVRLPFRPVLRFCYMYILRLGFLDGWAGYSYCRLMAQYESWIVLKMRELKSP